MKRIIAVVLSSLHIAASAATLPPPPPLPPALVSVPALPPVTDFKTYGSGLPLADFLRITVGQVLRKPYVLTPTAAADATLISADLSRVKPADLLSVLKEVLDASGYVLRDVKGVYVVDKRPLEKQVKADEANLEMFVYAPRHRSIGAMSSYFSLFPELRFAYGAGLARQALTPALPSGAAPAGESNSSGGGLGSDFSTGATTFSQVNGDPSRLVVRGKSEDIEKFKSFLEQVDIREPVVLVRAYVFEVRKTNQADSGVSLAMSILNNRVSLNTGSVPESGGIAKLSFSTGAGSLSAAIGKLTSDSRVRLVHSPVLGAVDGSSASAIIGTETPTLGSVTTVQGASTQSVVYQSAGVLLTVAPRVFEEAIRLKISQEVSSFVKTDTGLAGTPTKLRRSFVSDVVVTSGEAVLLGGLQEASASHSSSKSILFFGGNSVDLRESEIVVLLSVVRA